MVVGISRVSDLVFGTVTEKEKLKTNKWTLQRLEEKDKTYQFGYVCYCTEGGEGLLSV